MSVNNFRKVILKNNNFTIISETIQVKIIIGCLKWLHIRKFGKSIYSVQGFPVIITIVGTT